MRTGAAAGHVGYFHEAVCYDSDEHLLGVVVPFLLDGVAGVAALNQPDGVHPTAEGQERVAENVWKVLRPLLTGPGSGP